MKLLILFLALIFIFLFIYKKNETFIEKFSVQNYNDKSIDLQDFFKRNTDLNYLDIRDQRKLSEMKKRLSNQVPPIINRNVGRSEQGMATVPAVDTSLTNRVPDNNSTSDIYNIPMPTFDLDKNFQPMNKPNENIKMNYADNVNQIQNHAQYLKKINNLEKQLKHIQIQTKKYKLDNNCQFIPSNSSENKCNQKYSSYSGASFSGTDISCGEQQLSKRAEGLAVIKHGSVVDVKITDPGINYSKSPVISFLNGGLGKKAYARGIIKDGKVIDVEILNQGTDYSDTPEVVFEKPNTTMFCHLCCKK